MKIEKLSHRQSCLLWEFCREHLPPSLQATVKTDGYGFKYGIKVVRENESWWRKMWDDGIATVTDREIELRHPEYFSDFESLCLAYEKQTGRSVTLRYWED